MLIASTPVMLLPFLTITCAVPVAVEHATNL